VSPPPGSGDPGVSPPENVLKLKRPSAHFNAYERLYSEQLNVLIWTIAAV